MLTIVSRRLCGARLAVPAAVALVSSLHVSAAQASLIAADGFESYSAGSISGLGGAGAGWQAGWSAGSTGTVVNKTMSYTGGTVNVAGGSKALQLSLTDNVEMLSRRFTAQTAGATVYFSLLFRVEAGNDIGDFIHFMLNNDAGATSNNESGGIGDLSQTTTTFGARIGSTNGGTTTVAASGDYALNTTYMLVGRMRDNPANTDGTNEYNEITLWVNPTTNVEAAPGTTWTIARNETSGSFSVLQYFSARVFTLDVGDQYFIDQLAIGSTFAGVVPEPATLALAGGAVMLLARRRSRR